jgi:hypothetical protein
MNVADAKVALPLPDLMHLLGLREHAKKTAHCPFHEDKNRSFFCLEERRRMLGVEMPHRLRRRG